MNDVEQQLRTEDDRLRAALAEVAQDRDEWRELANDAKPFVEKLIAAQKREFDLKRRVIEAAGYTICNHGVGTSVEGWCALLPGETEFYDNADEAEAAPEEIAHVQNYLGFFSSEQDLLDEVFEEVLDSITRQKEAEAA